MTVAELIAQLGKYDPELTVTVDGYEGGVTEKLNIERMLVSCNVNEDWYYGEHEEVYNGDIKEATGPTKNVINIGRSMPNLRR